MRNVTSNDRELIVAPDDLILITGASGFIGAALVHALLARGHRNLRCFVRPSSVTTRLDPALRTSDATVELFTGNLLSRDHCAAATKDAAVVFHLAAGRGEKSFPDAFMNSVVTTRNLLEACGRHGVLRRFVNVSSFAVYTNTNKRRWRLLDETCPVEDHPERRGDAYCFAKVKQDEIVAECCERFKLPYVIVRPGYVYGPGKSAITGRVGVGTFGIFLHLGGSNTVPLTFVDNCADAIVRAGVTKGIDGQVFNIVDDNLPSSRRFLRLYKRHVKPFRSLYVPRPVSYALCGLWEKYSEWSEGQLPPLFTRRGWHAYWKKTRYSNEKAKTALGWVPQVSTAEGLTRYFESCRQKEHHA